MKKLNLIAMMLFVAFMVLAFGTMAHAAVPTAPAAKSGNEIMLADFDTGDKPNNVGGDFGAWDKDPNDDTQGCQLSFDQDDAKG